MKNKIQINYGDKFNKLTVISVYSEKLNERSRRYADCICECGGTAKVEVWHLILNHTKSCGCVVKSGILRKKHGLCTHNLYNRYKKIVSRCYDTKNNRYYAYGGRGITVCDEWLNDFKVFYDWAINNGYEKQLQIDRIDVNGNYEPNNCRWATTLEQAKNKRNSVLFLYNGGNETLLNISKIEGLDYSKLRYKVIIKGCDLYDTIKSMKK